MDSPSFCPAADLFNHRCEQRAETSLLRVATEEALAGLPVAELPDQTDADGSSSDEDTPDNKAFSKLVSQEKTKLLKQQNKKIMQDLKQNDKCGEVDDFCANEDQGIWDEEDSASYGEVEDTKEL